MRPSTSIIYDIQYNLNITIYYYTHGECFIPQRNKNIDLNYI